MRIPHGNPAEELVSASGDAQLTVVGPRRRSSLSAVLLGSVSTKVATHAHGPVVVVRGRPTAGPVVVGLDNSPQSRLALGFALDAAHRYGTGLVAVRVWPDVGYAPSVPTLNFEAIALREEAQRELSDGLHGRTEQYPDVAVRRSTPRGHPVAELVDVARDARLLVVGHRGRGGFAGLMLGSVAAGVLHHASCPVAVLRGGVAEEEEG
ncbi:universal stress protein [Saccharopolyspora spinosporotrichia]